MFEAKLNQAVVLKHVLDAIRELVTDVNFNCDEDGMKLQAMDNSHVALVALQLRAGGFEQYRCDRQMTLGINIASFQKITKTAANEDILTLRAYDDGDVLSIVAETLNTDRVAEYEMKMMDIDIEHLGIPPTSYDAEIALPSSEFNRIIRDLKEMGESIRIEATKEGVKFSATGDIGSGAVMLKHNADAKKAVAVDQEKENEVTNIESDGDEDEDQEDEDTVKTKKLKVKKEPDETEEDETEDPSETQDPDESQDIKPKMNGAKGRKKKAVLEDEDEDEDGPEPEDEEDEEEDEEDEGDRKSKKRKLSKKGSSKTNGKSKGKKDEPAKEKAKRSKEQKEKEKKEKGEEDLSVSISLKQSVSLTFSIKYLSNFTKATPLAKRLTLHMSNEVPLLVAYEFDTGFVRYYLAPKIEDD